MYKPYQVCYLAVNVRRNVTRASHCCDKCVDLSFRYAGVGHDLSIVDSIQTAGCTPNRPFVIDNQLNLSFMNARSLSVKGNSGF